MLLTVCSGCLNGDSIKIIESNLDLEHEHFKALVSHEGEYYLFGESAYRGAECTAIYSSRLGEMHEWKLLSDSLSGKFVQADFVRGRLYVVTNSNTNPGDEEYVLHTFDRSSSEITNTIALSPFNGSYLKSIIYLDDSTWVGTFTFPLKSSRKFSIAKTTNSGGSWHIETFNSSIVQAHALGAAYYYTAFKVNRKVNWLYSVNFYTLTRDSAEFGIDISDFSFSNDGSIILLGQHQNQVVVQYFGGRLDKLTVLSSSDQVQPKKLLQHEGSVYAILSRTDKNSLDGFGGTTPMIYMLNGSVEEPVWVEISGKGALYFDPCVVSKAGIVGYIGLGRIGVFER